MRFALLIWAYEQTGAALTLGLLGFFGWIPFVLISPVAGVLVDRLDRRLVMIGADLGSALVTGLLLMLYSLGGLEIWHLFLAEALTAVFDAFQNPAYTSSISLLVPRDKLTRSNGLTAAANHASGIMAPILAGLLLNFAGLRMVLIVDLVTFAAAMLTLMAVFIPRPVKPGVTDAPRRRMRDELQAGVRFIAARQGLLALLVMFMIINLLAHLTYFSILPALILARTGGDRLALSTVQAVLGAGGLIGSLAVTLWGAKTKRIHGFLLGTSLSFLTGDLVFAVGQSLPVWVAGSFLTAFFIPFITSTSLAIWQSKVPPHLQGRVFSVRSMGQTAMIPIGYLAGGFLADRLFEPAMQAGGSLEPIFGTLVGSGPGAGMGLMFLFTCITGVLMGLIGYLIPAIRNIEERLPDHDAEEPGEGAVI